MHTILQKIWDACTPAHKKVDKLRNLPDKLRHHVCAGLHLPLDKTGLPDLLMYHIKTRGDLLVCDTQGINPTDNTSIKEEFMIKEEIMLKEEYVETDCPFVQDLPALEKMDIEDDLGEDYETLIYDINGDGVGDHLDLPSITPVHYTEENHKGSVHLPAITFENEKKAEETTPLAVSDNQPQLDQQSPSTPSSQDSQVNIQLLEEDLQEQMYLETQAEINSVLLVKQRAASAYTGLTYRYNARYTLNTILGTSDVFLDIPAILAKYHRGLLLPLHEVIKLDTARHIPLIHAERKELAEEQVTMRIVNYQGHLDEVTEDCWTSGQPKCSSCNLHHSAKGRCVSLNYGLPALAATNNHAISLEHLQGFKSVFASFDEKLQIIGSDFRLSVLNLSPEVNHPAPLQLLQHSPSDLVKMDSDDYAYEFDITARLLVLTHKLGESELPLLILPRFEGNMLERQHQIRAAATAIANVQSLYKGMIITICPIAIYKSGMTADDYMEEKRLSRSSGDCLTAQLTSRGLAAITLEIAAMPVDDLGNILSVRDDWKLKESLYTLDGRKRREFYRRFADLLDHKLHMILRNQITDSMIQNMKKKKTMWEMQSGAKSPDSIHTTGDYNSLHYLLA